jgi:hypothetical protein
VIKLTDGAGHAVWINPDAVVYVKRNAGTTHHAKLHTVIAFEGQSIAVQESVDEIVGLLKAAP